VGDGAFDRGPDPVEGGVAGLADRGQFPLRRLLVWADDPAPLVPFITNHPGSIRGVVAGPPLGDAGLPERPAVVPRSRAGVTHIRQPTTQCRHKLDIDPTKALLIREQILGAVAFPDRGHETVDQHSTTSRLTLNLIIQGRKHHIDQDFQLVLVPLDRR
jgi:hypothetical protein